MLCDSGGVQSCADSGRGEPEESGGGRRAGGSVGEEGCGRQEGGLLYCTGTDGCVCGGGVMADRHSKSLRVYVFCVRLRGF